MKQPLYNMTLEYAVEDCTTDLVLKSGFDYLDLIISRSEKEVAKVNLEVSDCKQLIEMLQLVLKHSGVQE